MPFFYTTVSDPPQEFTAFQSGWEQLTLARLKSAQPFGEQTFMQGP